MENTNYYFNQAQQPYYQQPMPYMNGYGYDPSMYGYQPMVMQNMPQPSFASSLTQDEMNELGNRKPNIFDVNVSPLAVMAAVCNHKNGKDMVQQLNDGSGNVWCPMCNSVWSPEPMTKEEVVECINKIVTSMQNVKWIGDLPIELTRDLFSIIPLLEKYPDIYEYAMNRFNKYVNANNMLNASDASIYNNYNSLVNAGGYYPQPMMPGYYGQPVAPQPQVAQQTGYAPSFTAPTTAPQQYANPSVNPMQATYGVNPAAPNQQFVNQANTMMGGSVYGSYQQPMQANYYGQPVAQQVPQQQPGYAPNFAAPTAPAQHPQTDQQTVSVDENGKIAESKSKIDL